jgi:hypothetical protein
VTSSLLTLRTTAQFDDNHNNRHSYTSGTGCTLSHKKQQPEEGLTQDGPHCSRTLHNTHSHLCSRERSPTKKHLQSHAEFNSTIWQQPMGCAVDAHTPACVSACKLHIMIASGEGSLVYKSNQVFSLSHSIISTKEVHISFCNRQFARTVQSAHHPSSSLCAHIPQIHNHSCYSQQPSRLNSRHQSYTSTAHKDHKCTHTFPHIALRFTLPSPPLPAGPAAAAEATATASAPACCPTFIAFAFSTPPICASSAFQA